MIIDVAYLIHHFSIMLFLNHNNLRDLPPLLIILSHGLIYFCLFAKTQNEKR
jgi:hypothetical protein